MAGAQPQFIKKIRRRILILCTVRIINECFAIIGKLGVILTNTFGYDLIVGIALALLNHFSNIKTSTVHR